MHIGDLKVEGARLASRALMAGTAMCASWGIASVFLIRYTMDVHSVKEFGDKMRVVVGGYNQHLHTFFNPKAPISRKNIAD